ncbi:MAG: 16S rRNA (cytidine(1402)-2'-O)-methyltransferase [Bacillota bacterium]|nr:16S rRNA (cytidine(1402)-2'-O)-methyltransferase [Bacillota bacterium]
MEVLEPGLYLVATPIGNLGDMTLRGLEVLKRADLIAAEDTRHSRILLEHYQIKTPMISYHQHNTVKRRQELLELLRRGKALALISDAGTPAISDPGEDLVKAAAAEDIAVHPIPGGNAPLSAITASALDCRRFFFEGFLPKQKRERLKRLEAIKNIEATLIFYVTPHGLNRELADIKEVLGDRNAALCRELTKVHETFHRMPLGAMEEMAKDKELKGEMVLVVAGAEAMEEAAPDAEILTREVRELMNEGVRSKIAAKIIAEKYGMKKNEIYPLTLEKSDNKEN